MSQPLAKGVLAGGIEIPLPGHYPTLTMQLNVTLYQSAAVGRLVCILREPSDGVEVRREHANHVPLSELEAGVVAVVRTLIADALYLQGHQGGAAS